MLLFLAFAVMLILGMRRWTAYAPALVSVAAGLFELARAQLAADARRDIGLPATLAFDSVGVLALAVAVFAGFWIGRVLAPTPR